MATWHADENKRKAIGDEYEDLFPQQVNCHCGGAFVFVGNVKRGFPDFTCDNCGQLADVKSSPQSERTGNIAVSQIPWDNYPDDMLLVTNIGGQWLGAYKRHIDLGSVSRAPTHAQAGRFASTRFYLIGWRQFRSLNLLGYKVSK